MDNAKTEIKDGVYYLDASLSLPLSKAPINAVKSGVPLFLELKVSIIDDNNWWLDSEIASIHQVFKLEYFAIAKLYQTTNLNTQEQNNYLTLDAALESIGGIHALPLIDQILLDKNENYYININLDLLVSKLPLPLIPVALLASEWEHQSSTLRLVLK